MITQGILGPGVHLGQVALAQRFGASCVPVREALKLLVSEGLIRHDANRGFFVSPLSLDDALQLHRVRFLFEQELLSGVARPDSRQLSALRDKQHNLEWLLLHRRRREWIAARRDFHRTVLQLSKQKIMLREVLRLWTRTDRCRSLSPPQFPADAQEFCAREVVQALATGNRKKLLNIFYIDSHYRERTLRRILCLDNNRSTKRHVAVDEEQRD